jgi:hypothetical protein
MNIRFRLFFFLSFELLVNFRFELVGHLIIFIEEEMSEREREREREKKRKEEENYDYSLEKRSLK